jgi:plastocyanin
MVRTLVLAASALVLATSFAAPAAAKASHDVSKQCRDHGHFVKCPPAAATVAPGTKATITHRTEIRKVVHTTSAPAGKATAKCKDGTLSYSKTHSGSCSHHGGVAQWLS